MRLRTLSGLILLAALFGVVFFAPPWALPIAMAAVSVIGVHEFLCAAGFLSQKRLIVYAMVFACLIPIWTFFGSNATAVIAGIFFLTLVLFIEAITSSKTVTIENICVIFFAAVAIPYFLSAIVRICVQPHGRLLLLVPLIGAFASDVFAMFGGKLFGKTKLCPSISPNKTVEGSISGLVAGPAILLLYAVILKLGFGYQSVDYLSAATLGIACAFSGQLGDLSMSFVKRQYGIKDFGKIIPGHGGALDRFDSVLFAAPVAELLMIILPFLG